MICTAEAFHKGVQSTALQRMLWKALSSLYKGKVGQIQHTSKVQRDLLIDEESVL